MKQTIQLIYIVTLLFFGTIQGQEASASLKYMQSIAGLQRPLMQKSWNYIHAFAHSTEEKELENAQKELVQSLEEGLSKIKAMPAYQNDTTFRDIGIAYFGNMVAIFKEEYAEMAALKDDILSIYLALEEYMTIQDTANRKMKQYLEIFQQAQADFAKNHNITLIKDNSDLAKKIEISNEVISYRNQLHLIFFKSYTIDNEVTDFLQKEDINGLKKSNEKLKISVKEGLKKLKNHKAYANDDTLKKAVSTILDKYNKEATSHIPDIMNYYQATAEFSKNEVLINKTSERKRTQKMVDNYNNSAERANKAGKKYNKAIDKINNIKADVIVKWNTAWPKFIDKHIPKDEPVK